MTYSVGNYCKLQYLCSEKPLHRDWSSRHHHIRAKPHCILRILTDIIIVSIFPLTSSWYSLYLIWHHHRIYILTDIIIISLWWCNLCGDTILTDIIVISLQWRNLCGGDTICNQVKPTIKFRRPPTNPHNKADSTNFNKAWSVLAQSVLTRPWRSSL